MSADETDRAGVVTDSDDAMSGDQPSRLRRVGRWLWRPRVFFVFVPIFLVLLFFVPMGWHAFQYRRTVARLRAAGEPVTLEEVLAEIPTVPAEENSVDQMVRAGAWVDNESVEFEMLDELESSFGRSYDKSAREILERCLQAQKPFLEKAEHAAELEHGAFGAWNMVIVSTDPPDVGLTCTALYDWLTAHRALWDILQAETLLAAAAEDTDRISRALRIWAGTADVPPEYVGWWGTLPGRWMTMHIEHILSAGEFPDEAIREWEVLIPPACEPMPRERVALLRAEILACIDTTREQIVAMAEEPERLEFLGPLFRLAAWRGQSRARRSAIEYFARLDSLVQPLREGDWTAFEDASRELELITQLYTSPWIKSPYFNRFFAIHLILGQRDLIDSQIRVYFRHEADRRLALTALACERYRLAEGHWPEHVEQLVPDYMENVPMQMATREPIDIIPDPKGVRLRIRGWEGGDGGALTEEEASMVADFVNELPRDPEELLEPDSVDELVPDYLEQVPKDPKGRWAIEIDEWSSPPVEITGLDYDEPVPPEAEAARIAVEDAVQAYRRDVLKRFAEQRDLQVPLDPLSGEPLQMVEDTESRELVVRFDRPAGPVVLSDVEYFGHADEFLFRLLDPEHRGQDPISIVELLGDNLAHSERSPEQIERFREFGFAEEQLRELGVVEEEAGAEPRTED